MRARKSENSGFRLKDIISIYSSGPPRTKAHVIVRYLTCPLTKIEPYIPQEGRILEIGCGHGLFTQILARTSRKRELIGIDIAQDKIAAAKETSQDRIRFVCIDFFDLQETSLDAVVLIDVLYLIPYDEQIRMLERIFGVLKNGGTLILKTMDKKPCWKYLVNYLQETMAVRVFHLTEGCSLTFHRSEALRVILENIGFSVDIVPLHRGYPHPHCLIVCEKK